MSSVMNIAQTADESVEAYMHKISEKQAKVDACARLVDAECRVGSSVAYNYQKSKIPSQIEIA